MKTFLRGFFNSEVGVGGGGGWEVGVRKPLKLNKGVRQARIIKSL